MENNKIRENTKRVGASTHPTLARLAKSIFQAACIILLLNACQKPKPEIDRSPTCVPDKPVNWGEIYSQYMHKKFEKYVDEIWDADEWNNRNEPDWGLHDNIYDKSKRRVGARTHAVHTVGILPSFFYFQPTFTIFQSTTPPRYFRQPESQ